MTIRRALVTHSPTDPSVAPPARYFRLFAPFLLFLVLALPLLSFPFLMDDFSFLQRARSFTLAQLLPDPHVALYRPLSRELYFGLLAAVGGNNPLPGHVFNLILALGCVGLVASIGRRVGGDKGGLFAGLMFASLGALPFLVGWISGCQDLFAMLFTLAAIRLQMSGRTGLALCATGAALLSKETTVFALPGLALWSGIMDRDWVTVRRRAWYYAGLLAIWILLNSKMREFASRGFVTGASGYTGLDNPRLLTNLAREFATLFNIPINNPGWLPGLGAALAIGLLILGVAAFLTSKVNPTKEAVKLSACPIRFGVLFGIIPAVLTAISVKHWTPYYACFPAIGTSVALSAGLRRTRREYAFSALGVFLLLGIWVRGEEFGTRLMPMERNLTVLAQDLKRIDAELHRLHRSLPDSSRLYVAVNAPLQSGLHSQLMQFQAAKVWYWNGTLMTTDPIEQHPGAGPEYLFWITPQADVFEIDVPTLQTRSPGKRPDYGDYQSTVRIFAAGLAASGQTDRAVDAVLRMQESDSLTLSFDRRLAATFLFAAGRDAEAERLCAGLRPVPKSQALYAVAAILGLETPNLILDQAALRSYAVPLNDPESYRFLMLYLSDKEELPSTERMAERLMALVPNDPEARQMIEAIHRVPNWQQVVPPVP